MRIYVSTGPGGIRENQTLSQKSHRLHHDSVAHCVAVCFPVLVGAYYSYDCFYWYSDVLCQVEAMTTHDPNLLRVWLECTSLLQIRSDL